MTDRPENAASRRIEFLGVPLDTYTMQETIDLAVGAMTQHEKIQHVVVNVGKLVNMRRDAILQRDVEESDLINIDGAGILWGCRLLGLPVTERVAGIDIMGNLLAACEAHEFRPYFFGAKQEVLDQAIKSIMAKHPKLRIAGARHGYFAPNDEAAIVADINQANADCLFIAISTPTKENFIHRYRDALDVSFIMGVGGSIDVYAGFVKRAPPWMQNAGLEWFFRLVQEPRRMWKRYLVTNSAYAYLLLGAWLRKCLRLNSGQ